MAGSVVYDGFGKPVGGAPATPAKTRFQFSPVQPPIWELRVSHCCCPPESTVPSIVESEIQPPLAQPPSTSVRPPRTCMRRYGAAWETAHRSWPPVGVTDRFSAPRQKFWVALPWNQSASACTRPLIVTSSGDAPSPSTCV
ncbi:hypothetical protein GCM10009530_38600 [Microbispora corallina]|uniref:Uncharacterized protein n=1 Tax=Microbispora corallina TaxID=83302 RepID=A0ABQ4G2K8_9ACTN|nr:hypothetical protein [Microbispora corallina]GIH41308.1 hypothetical protein Mco01_43080 [Microbispora corallina]